MLTELSLDQIPRLVVLNKSDLVNAEVIEGMVRHGVARDRTRLSRDLGCATADASTFPGKGR